MMPAFLSLGFVESMIETMINMILNTFFLGLRDCLLDRVGLLRDMHAIALVGADHVDGRCEDGHRHDLTDEQCRHNIDEELDWAWVT